MSTDSQAPGSAAADETSVDDAGDTSDTGSQKQSKQSADSAPANEHTDNTTGEMEYVGYFIKSPAQVPKDKTTDSSMDWQSERYLSSADSNSSKGKGRQGSGAFPLTATMPQRLSASKPYTGAPASGHPTATQGQYQVLVLIDGDYMSFHDGLIKHGRAGGGEALRLLRNNVRVYFHERHNVPRPNMRVTIRVYADVAHLEQSYEKAGAEFRLQPFISGFNHGGLFSKIVDSGGRTHEKLKAACELGSSQYYQLILFGGSPDCLSHLHTDRAPPANVKILHEGAGDLAMVAKYCSKLASPADLPCTGPAVSHATMPSTIRTIRQNAAGQRVDNLLAHNGVASEEHCFNYHIHGICGRGDICVFEHPDSIADADMGAMRYKAMKRRCEFGSRCMDPDCKYGHHCRYRWYPPVGRGPNGVLHKCKFPPDLHNIDQTIAREVEVPSLG